MERSEERERGAREVRRLGGGRAEGVEGGSDINGGHLKFGGEVPSVRDTGISGLPGVACRPGESEDQALGG